MYDGGGIQVGLDQDTHAKTDPMVTGYGYHERGQTYRRR